MRGKLLGDLEKIFADPKGTEGQRLSAANAFADYAASDIAKLSQLLTVATPEQYSVLNPLVATNPSPTTVEEISKIAATLPEAELGSVERVPFGRPRANAAVTLMRLGEREKVLHVFDMTDDPEALTQFIFRCRPRGVGIDALLDMLQLIVESKGSTIIPTRSVSEGKSSNASARYALLLAIGEFTLNEIPESRRDPFLKQLSDTYRHDPSSGVHGATGWLLRQWGQADVVREVDQTPEPYSLDREWFTLAITVTPKSPPKPIVKPGKEKGELESEPEPPVEPLPRKTFHYTFIVFPSGSSEIGSVADEPDPQKDELRHAVTLTRPFALLDREVTMEELIAFEPEYARYMKQYDAGICGYVPLSRDPQNEHVENNPPVSHRGMLTFILATIERPHGKPPVLHRGQLTVVT